jgi:hypothetical protein
MNYIWWIIREILYFPKFLLMCLLSLIFGLIGFRKGLVWLQKIL